jgi:hypothetical protein
MPIKSPCFSPLQQGRTYHQVVLDFPGAGWCRRMPCPSGDSGGSSTSSVGLGRPLLGSVGVDRGVKVSKMLTLEELVHRPAALVLHVLEDVGVTPEGHGGVGVAKHLRDGVEGHPLAQRERSGGRP